MQSELARDTAEATNCDVVVLPIKVTYDNEETKTIQMPFGFCSAHGVFGIPAEDYLHNMKKYSALMPTIVMPHMGAEYKSVHDTLRQNLYHKMIDYGVDAVIGDHPHWTQDAEAYKGKLIVYSMGNFMFDQVFSKEVSRSAAIEANAVVNGMSSAKVVWQIKRLASRVFKRPPCRASKLLGLMTIMRRLRPAIVFRA